MTHLAGQREQRERRQARQWQDAEVLADVYRLLVDIDPARRGAEVLKAPGHFVVVVRDMAVPVGVHRPLVVVLFPPSRGAFSVVAAP
jgi:hypothetical protein